MQDAFAVDPVSRASSFVATNPGLTAAVAIGVVVTVVVVAYLVFRRRRPNGVRFKNALAEHDDVAILMHPNPDPDAMAAAIGVACLARQVGTRPTIQFPGQIRRQENRAFRTVLDLDFDRIAHVSDLAAEAVVLVDHNTPRGFAGAPGILPFAVVDHHPGDGSGERFTDVRTDYGATASIVAEYLADVGAKPVPPDIHESEVDATYTVPSGTATGLLYGILADTKHLTNGASAPDYEAAGYLHGGIDDDALDRIANPQVDAETLEIKAQAIAGRQVDGSFAVSDVGTVSNTDAIPQAADELITLEGVSAVVVVGEREGTVHLSGRSRDDRVHMGRALEHVVDDTTGGSAGGHARMGGGTLPTPAAAATDGGSEVIDRDAVVDHVFAALNGDV
ncbi:MAG: bifunctional oligoribonuclease/PAP phosphatase NrnA [Halolamina sp.]